MHSKSHLCNLGPQERLSEESQRVTATNMYSSQLKSRGGWITFAHPSSRNLNQTHSSEKNLLGPPESRFQGRGMHFHPDTLPWNPGMQQGGSERGSLAAASPRDHPAQVQSRIKAPESAGKILLFLLTWIMAKTFWRSDTATHIQELHPVLDELF